MKEQSHIDDMRAAVRGDLERARTRRESSAILQAEPPPSAERPADEDEDEPRGWLTSLFRRR